MYDMHYDLLTAAYIAKLNNNLDDIKKWIIHYNSNNVTGIVANMCFMSQKEMQERYHKNYYDENIPVSKMFKGSVDLVKELMDDNINITFSIEGCDYLSSIDELDILYDLGLRLIAPVWDEPNKYGSGIRGDYGLTLEGKKLIHKAIELGIGIDLSHTNEKTFTDIIKLIKEYRNNGIKPLVVASHSNSKILCNIERNLSDEQLKQIREVDGFVGIMANRNFIMKDALKNKYGIKRLKEMYIRQLVYAGSIVGFDHLMVSTGDIKFSLGNEDYKKLPIYNYETIANDLRIDLSKYLSDEMVDNIMFNNAKKVLKKVKGGNYERKSRNIM